VQALVISPQFLPSAMHSSGVTLGSQRFAMPRTPQLSPALQPKPGTVSQFTVPPQPFEMTPHSSPFFAFASAHRSAADFGVQLGSQVWKTVLHFRALPSLAGEQLPQSVWLAGMSSPQPSQAFPHSNPRSLHVTGWHSRHLWVSGSHSLPGPQPFGLPSGQSR
jgi:hypothetical protein